MNKIIPFIFACLLLQSFTVQSEEFDPYTLPAEHYNDASIKDKAEFSDKKGNQFRIKNSKYSRGLYIRHDKKWKKHGIFYSLSSGRVTSQTTYHYGEKNGPHLSFHSNGKVSFQYNYFEGKKHGQWYQYRDNGSLVEEKEYKNGLKDGPRTSYFSRKDGQTGPIQFTSTNVKGKTHGEKLQYNEDGKIVARSQYNMGKKIGKTQWSH